MQSLARISLLVLLSSLALPASCFSALVDAAEEWQWPWSKKQKTVTMPPWARRAEVMEAPEVEAKPAAAEAETTQAPAAVDEETAPYRDPLQPGCYMRMPSGCPKMPMRTHLWRHDTWAEKQGLDEKACQKRKSVWNNYCESQDAVMVFVANETLSEPLSALQISSESQWPWGRKRKEAEAKQGEEAAAAETEAKQAAPAASGESAVKEPSKPGCYMRMPSGCPKKPMRTVAWRHDTWAENHNFDEAACQERKKVWDAYCESLDALMIFVPKQ